MTLTFRALRGAALDSALDDLARLRIEVFSDWPYLYDGDAEYERRYVETYRDNPRAILVAALDGDRIVGAATGAPMEDHAADFGAAFRSTGYALNEIFYCSESVLLPRYRGKGAGHRFFDLREEQGRALGRSYSAFCAVIRPEDHPARPARYRPLDGFWAKRGYRKLDGVKAEFPWREHGEREESVKRMQFWIRSL